MVQAHERAQEQERLPWKPTLGYAQTFALSDPSSTLIFCSTPAVSAFEWGAFDYLLKPFDKDRLTIIER